MHTIWCPCLLPAMPPLILLSCWAMWNKKRVNVISLHEISQSYQIPRVGAGWILTILCCATHSELAAVQEELPTCQMVAIPVARWHLHFLLHDWHHSWPSMWLWTCAQCSSWWPQIWWMAKLFQEHCAVLKPVLSWMWKELQEICRAKDGIQSQQRCYCLLSQSAWAGWGGPSPVAGTQLWTPHGGPSCASSWWSLCSIAAAKADRTHKLTGCRRPASCLAQGLSASLQDPTKTNSRVHEKPFFVEVLDIPCLLLYLQSRSCAIRSWGWRQQVPLTPRAAAQCSALSQDRGHSPGVLPWERRIPLSPTRGSAKNGTCCSTI